MTTIRIGLEQSTLNDERIEIFINQPLDNGFTRGEQMELVRELQARRKADKWIPISECFPDDETVILVADCTGVVWGAEVQEGTIYPDDWAYMNRFGSREATHWKPMPQAKLSENGD
ncbi:DUF551 domain-containing protein [Buttiauxella selenatireducens]|uniref:DUF551 domain-containing protein n=1 Tax=Buttiauxella selenatireducens TaxID=3073902 RepID=A0ABY9S8K9_9ENTR|nr:DUF551 domain-containing protein [Buttiauxella sp. R73]WMY72771.1 DUF551 domain-containing protein [Buttiauxella sp. R73]